MTWRYRQSTGELFHDAQRICAGYSGAGPGKNNPAMQHVRSVGPIPAGDWSIGQTPYDSDKVGPYAIRLEPVGHNACGRTAFRIHGDSVRQPGTASNGCIILPRAVRERIIASGDRHLQVSP